jgi:hypothetical protein
MPESSARPRCPHCQAELLAFSMPEGGGWHKRVQWACFNDDCPYYAEGWAWMWEQYRVRASYRYRLVDRDSTHDSPLAVWSPTALRHLIIEDS